MKKIELANGRGVALVDDEDYEELSQYKWRVNVCDGHTYAARSQRFSGAPRTIRMHRQLLAPGRGELVDHRNGNGLDNQRSNLRIASRSLNAFNVQSARANSESGVLGVRHDSSTGWRVRLWKGGRQIHLGYFDGIGDAVVARRDAELKYYGEVTPATQRWLDERSAA